MSSVRFSKPASATDKQRGKGPANSVTIRETNYLRSKAYSDTGYFNVQKSGDQQVSQLMNDNPHEKRDGSVYPENYDVSTHTLTSIAKQNQSLREQAMPSDMSRLVIPRQGFGISRPNKAAALGWLFAVRASAEPATTITITSKSERPSPARRARSLL